MDDTERIKCMEIENEKLKEENKKLRSVIAKLNQTLNRLIGHYIKSDKIA